MDKHKHKDIIKKYTILWFRCIDCNNQHKVFIEE